MALDNQTRDRARAAAAAVASECGELTAVTILLRAPRRLSTREARALRADLVELANLAVDLSRYDLDLGYFVARPVDL